MWKQIDHQYYVLVLLESQLIVKEIHLDRLDSMRVCVHSWKSLLPCQREPTLYPPPIEDQSRKSASTSLLGSSYLENRITICHSA